MRTAVVPKFQSTRPPHEWFGQLLRGEASGIGDFARAERLDRSYVTRVLCLAFLGPEITNMILEGRQPTELTSKRLINFSLQIPLLWSAQRECLVCNSTTVEQNGVITASTVTLRIWQFRDFSQSEGTR